MLKLHCPLGPPASLTGSQQHGYLSELDQILAVHTVFSAESPRLVFKLNNLSAHGDENLISLNNMAAGYVIIDLPAKTVRQYFDFKTMFALGTKENDVYGEDLFGFEYGPITRISSSFDAPGIVARKKFLSEPGQQVGFLEGDEFWIRGISFNDVYADPASYFNLFEHDGYWTKPQSNTPIPLNKANDPAGMFAFCNKNGVVQKGSRFVSISGGSRKLKIFNPDNANIFTFLSTDDIKLEFYNRGANTDVNISVEDVTMPNPPKQDHAYFGANQKTTNYRTTGTNPFIHAGRIDAYSFKLSDNLLPYHDPYKSLAGVTLDNYQNVAALTVAEKQEIKRLKNDAALTSEQTEGIGQAHLEFLRNGSRFPGKPLTYRFRIRIGVDAFEFTIQQDTLDVIRQEYVFHQLTRLLARRELINKTTNYTDFPFLRHEGFFSNNYSDYRSKNFYGTIEIEKALRVTDEVQSLFIDEVKAAIAAGTINIPANIPKDLRISSFWRNPERNEEVGGALQSKHQYGFAVDLVPIAENKPRKVELLKLLFEVGRKYLQNTIPAADKDKAEILLEKNTIKLLRYEYDAGNNTTVLYSYNEQGEDPHHANIASVQQKFTKATHVHVAWKKP